MRAIFNVALYYDGYWFANYLSGAKILLYYEMRKLIRLESYSYKEAVMSFNFCRNFFSFFMWQIKFFRYGFVAKDQVSSLKCN